MSLEISALERARHAYLPRLPALLGAGIGNLVAIDGAATTAVRDGEALRVRFPRSYGRPLVAFRAAASGPERRPLRLGVVLSGGQAPGGHNVIAGLYDAIVGLHDESRLYGFLGGPKGILTGACRELERAAVDAVRNTGGFDLIGSGRDKIETDEHFAACRATCERLALDGLVIVGGDDSNTNAALLAEDFLARGLVVTVNGVPKTIDGDLRGAHVELSFGFDTATRVYAELIGNICRDAKSAGKYWHFVKLMGRSASHVTLECALATRPNVALIGEEIEERGATLDDIADHVAGVVRRRAEAGRRYGVCLVPEGLIEFVPEMRRLIAELNAIVAAPGVGEPATEAVTARLGDAGRRVFAALPARIQSQLLLDRDAHGNVQVSKIDTEQLLVGLVERRVGRFQVQPHFLGYEGRCAAPSNFDADYTYTLGFVAAALAAGGRTGYLCGVSGLSGVAESWTPLGVPLTSMMQLETRKGRPVPVIAKALVRTGGAVFQAFAAARERWATEDHYVYPGPIQYFGPPEICDARPLTLALESTP